MVPEQNVILLTNAISTMRAWTPGIIQDLLDQDLHIQEAQLQAYLRGHLLDREVKKNILTTVGLQLVIDALIDEELGMSYHAIGTGTTTPALGDTTLTTEVARKAYTDTWRTSLTMNLSVFYLGSECNYNIKEVGQFGGDTASATANTGTLLSHLLHSYDNSGGSPNDMTFDYTVLVREG